MKKGIFIFGLIGLLLATGNVFSNEAPKDLLFIKHAYEGAVHSNNLPYIWKAPDYLLVEWDSTQQMQAKLLGIPFEVIAKNVDKSKDYYIFEINKTLKIPYEWRNRILYRYGQDVIIQMGTQEAEEWVNKGYHTIKLFHKDHYVTERAAFIPFICTYNATVADLLSRTNVTQWTDWDEKLSGVEPVVLGGTTYTVRTRYTDSMFNGSVDGKGYDFVLQTSQSLHYGSNIEEDPYGTNRKNLILTIPGQTTPNQIVGASAHLDDVPASGVAPGADDNASGSVMLLEVARLFRQFRFQRTVKIMFFTGEEQGLLGSDELSWSR